MDSLSSPISDRVLSDGVYRSRIFWRLLLSISTIVLVLADRGEKDIGGSTHDGFSPKALYFQTVTSWQSSGGKWETWKEFSSTLVAALEKTHSTNIDMPSGSALPPSGTTQKLRLEIIGAIEEGILVIERHLSDASSNGKRGGDVTLADLYTAYARVLSDLSVIECWKLASDPYTLLIGAPEKIKQYRNELLLQPSSNTTGDNAASTSALLADLFGNLCIDNAENALRNAISLDATNTQATHLLERITGKDATTVHERKPTDFVAELFDSFADSFDEKLVNQLDYRVPELIGKVVRELPPVAAATLKNENVAVFRAVLDAGCGTGLVGRQLLPIVSGPLVGVDASSKMLEIAALCTRSSGCGLDTTAKYIVDKTDTQPLYDSLLKMDLEDMTIVNTLKDGENSLTAKGFDLIVAADVLVYFGTLERILEVFASLSSSSIESSSLSSLSWLIFTCELATTDDAPLGFRLLPTGRFSHTKEHAVNMASRVGYELVQYREIVPRMEKGEPVQGHLFVFRRVPTNMDEGNSYEL